MSILTDHPERMKTAVVMAIVLLLVGLIDNTFITWLFLGSLYALALSEVMPLLKISDPTIPYMAGAAVWLAAGIYPHPSDLIVLALLILAGYLAYKRNMEPRIFLSMLYPTIGMIFVWMLYSEYGMVALLWLLVVVGATDTGAYYTGRSIGKRPFSPTSPNKTLEGVIGGVILGTIGGVIISTGWMGVGFIAAVITSFLGSKLSVFGDLFESYLKREAGVKDSGTILPGHGGVLDRIDGYLFAAPTLYTLLKIFGY